MQTIYTILEIRRPKSGPSQMQGRYICMLIKGLRICVTMVWTVKLCRTAATYMYI